VRASAQRQRPPGRATTRSATNSRLRVRSLFVTFVFMLVSSRLVSSRIVSVVQAAHADPSRLFHDHAARIHAHTLTPSIFSPSSRARFPPGIANPPRTSDLPQTRTNTTWTHHQFILRRRAGLLPEVLSSSSSHIPPSNSLCA
jgi:hypothetical protein